ncbi:MAG: hypothetical protein ABR532_02310, partial [Candidatus Dormibacteria bacterium]
MRRLIARLGFIASTAALVVLGALPAGACIDVPFSPQIDLAALPAGPQIQQFSNDVLTYAVGALVIGGIMAIAFAAGYRRAANAGAQAGAMETAAKVLGAVAVIGA